MQRTLNTAAGVFLVIVSKMAVAADCTPEMRKLMPSASELASACPAEPLFKQEAQTMGSATMCHYDFGKTPGIAGMMVSKEMSKSAKEAAESNASIKVPGYTLEAKKMPWSGIEVWQYAMGKDGSVLSSDYYADSPKGVLHVEVWISDPKTKNACAEKAIRAVMAKATK